MAERRRPRVLTWDTGQRLSAAEFAAALRKVRLTPARRRLLAAYAANPGG